MHPGHRHIQMGVRSLGYDPGEIDGWWGPRTARAAVALDQGGPIKSTEWAIMQLQTGLSALGHDPGPVTGSYDARTKAALGRLIDADGMPAAAAVSQFDRDPVAAPLPPRLTPQAHGLVLRQGSAGYVIDSFMQHTAATPGSWWQGKSNREMLAEIRRWHTTPVARGGRGWSDIGYHRVIFPDGEILDGRPISKIGAGAIGHNQGYLHACMIPVRTIERMRNPEDHYTAETLASMKAEIARIAGLTSLRRLSGHNEVAAKLCPGFDVIDRDWTHQPVI